MGIRILDIKILYALSAGKCNICNIDIVDGNTHIGEVAHIIASSPDGPRGDIDRSIDINGHQNLILLCPNHHTAVDKSPEIYTVEYLKEMKKNHEEKIKKSLGIPNKYHQIDAEVLTVLFDYIPITRYIHQVFCLPSSIYIDFADPSEMYESFYIENPQYYPFNDAVLHEKFIGFLQSYEELNEWLSGRLQGDRFISFHQEINQKTNEYTYSPCVSPYVGSSINDRPIMQLNKKNLTSSQLDITCNRINLIKSKIINSCLDLIIYIKKNYPDVVF